MPQKIFLIGLPGSGKSTLGNRLADRIGYPFIDLDEVIEKEAGRKITQIFATEGEEYFRELEREALLKMLDKDEHYILATGGGTPCFFDNIERINQSGFSIFIQTPIATIVARLLHNKNRPLLQTATRTELTTRITDLLHERLPFYQQAQAVVESGKPNDILKLLKS